jgi:DNA polymerase III delta prime subunit
MIQSHIFLTHTYVDNHDLASIITYHYFEKTKLDFSEIDFNISREKRNKLMEKMANQQRVKMISFDSKKDYRDEIMSLYKHYEKPFLLFLGNISEYSSQLQEGMLRLLEEPPKNLIIILFSHSRSELLPTISSRSRVHNLQMQDIFQVLHKGFTEQARKKLPTPLDISKAIIGGRFHYSQVKDISKIDREVIGLWLWQVNMYLTKIYESNSTLTVSKSIKKVLQATELNYRNAQKKFVLVQLSL